MRASDSPNLERAVAEFHRGHDAEANFERIFRAYHPAVVGYFEHRGVPAEEALDLAQEVFLAVYTGVGALKDSGAFRSWLFGITRHKFLRHIEGRQLARQTGGEEAAEQLGKAPEALDQVLHDERRMKLREALEELPQQMRACVKLRVTEELEYPEIAQRLGVSVNSVKVHMHRARHQLAARLGPLFWG